MITEAIGQKGYLTSIDITDDEIITAGQTDSIDAVIAYVTVLEELGYYADVRIADFSVNDISDPMENMGNNVTSTVVITR